MKILGIIGGTGPESTIEYYRLIIAAYRDATKTGHYPHLLINSVDNRKLLDLVAANHLDEMTDHLVREIKRLAAAGADFGLFAANTPHLVFDEVSTHSPIPLLSIVEATCEEVKTRGLKKSALFGTRYTMQGTFYQSAFTRAGIQLVVPDSSEQEFIHDKYLNELLEGKFLEETRIELLRIASRLLERERIDGLILGGTELPLLLKQESYAGIPVLDTTRIHVQHAIREMLL